MDRNKTALMIGKRANGAKAHERTNTQTLKHKDKWTKNKKTS